MSSNVYNISTPSYGVQTAQYSMDVNIMRTALILFLVIIVVVVLLNVLHLYARCVIRRRTRLHTISLVDVSITGGQTNSHEQPKHGLEPSVIFSLPTFPYRKSDRVDETDAKECTVCLGTLEDDEMVKLLPNCKHMFHVDCIDMWLHSNSTCPVCRTGAKPVEPTDDLQAPLELNETGDAVVRVDFPEDSSNTMIPSSETVQDVAAQSVKEEESGGSVSDRLSSLRRILSRGRSIRDNQQSGQPEGDGDLERQ